MFEKKILADRLLPAVLKLNSHAGFPGFLSLVITYFSRWYNPYISHTGSIYKRIMWRVQYLNTCDVNFSGKIWYNTVFVILAASICH